VRGWGEGAISFDRRLGPSLRLQIPPVLSKKIYLNICANLGLSAICFFTLKSLEEFTSFKTNQYDKGKKFSANLIDSKRIST